MERTHADVDLGKRNFDAERSEALEISLQILGNLADDEMGLI